MPGTSCTVYEQQLQTAYIQSRLMTCFFSVGVPSLRTTTVFSSQCVPVSVIWITSAKWKQNPQKSSCSTLTTRWELLIFSCLFWWKYRTKYATCPGTYCTEQFSLGKIRCFSKLSCILLHVLHIHPLRSSVKPCQLTLWALLRYCGLISKYMCRHCSLSSFSLDPSSYYNTFVCSDYSME